jgi:hypothetical protein
MIVFEHATFNPPFGGLKDVGLCPPPRLAKTVVFGTTPDERQKLNLSGHRLAYSLKGL